MFGIFSRNCRRRSQGSSLRKRMAVSKVAPPHISKENRPLLASPILRAKASEQASMSKLRTRVAMSDW